MKKFMVALLSLTLLVGAALPVSAADLASAADGELVYTFNFNGDENFAPQAIKGFAENYTATVSNDGSSVTIKSKAGAEGKEGFWGGLIDGYTFAKTDKHNKYAFVYKIKANGAANANNRIGVGGYSKFFAGVTGESYTEVNGNYGNYATDGSGSFGIFVNNLIIWKDNPSVGVTGFVKASELDKQIDVDADGFMTMMIVYEGASDKYHTYALSKGGDVTKTDDWIYMQWANLGLKPTNYLGFLVYVNSNAVDTTIKDARIYKGLGYGTDPAGGFVSGNTSSSGGSSSNRPSSAQTADNTILLFPVMLAAVAVMAGGMFGIRKVNKR